jgi:HAD superfamily hydrolase (TIGR01549 family)
MGQPVAFAHVRGVVFDMDGTLIDSPLDFGRIRAEAGVPDGRPILEFLETAPAGVRERVTEVLLRHEREAAEGATLRAGAAELVRALAERGIKTALLTRNSAESVRTVLDRFGLSFDCWLSREHSEPKPSPQPVFKIAGLLGLEPVELLMVGDYVFDVQAGRAAGSPTAFVKNRGGVQPPSEADVVIENLLDLLDMLPQAH